MSHRLAGGAELADARDSKSRALHWACGFDPHLQHQHSPCKSVELTFTASSFRCAKEVINGPAEMQSQSSTRPSSLSPRMRALPAMVKSAHLERLTCRHTQPGRGS